MESPDSLGFNIYRSNEFYDKYVHNVTGKLRINSLPSTVLDRPIVEDFIIKHKLDSNLEGLTNITQKSLQTILFYINKSVCL